MPTYQSEESLHQFLDNLKDEAKAARGEMEKTVASNIEYFRGKQWNSKTAPVYLQNVVGSAIEDKIAKLSETRPEIHVMPTANGLGGVAEILTQAVSGIWDKRKIEYKAERLALWGAICGAAFVGTPWNNYLNGGIGDADFVVKDPRYCGMDICVTNPEDGDLGEYCYIEDFTALDKIQYEYPGRGALVKPDAKLQGYDSKSDTSAKGLITGAYSRLFRKGETPKVSAIPKAIIEEFYVKDRRRTIEDAGVVPMVENLTKPCDDGGVPFPGGRRILRAGRIILCDEYNPFWDGNPDLDMLGWKIDLESAWGPDEIKNVKRMQETHNRLGDAYSKSALMNAVSRVVMDKNALEPSERNKLSNEVNQIIEKALGRELNYMIPPPLPVDVINWAQTLKQQIMEMIGVAEPPLAKQTPSIVTGPAIEGLQIMTQSPIRAAARRIEEFYQRIGQKLISRIFQFYTSDRIIHLIGPDQKWMAFEFNRLNIIKDKNGKPRSKEDVQKAYRDFAFMVQPNSSLAISKTQRAQAKFMLVQLGLLHPREILREFYANPDEKIAEAQQAKQAGMFDAVQNAKGQAGATDLGIAA